MDTPSRRCRAPLPARLDEGEAQHSTGACGGISINGQSGVPAAAGMRGPGARNAPSCLSAHAYIQTYTHARGGARRRAAAAGCARLCMSVGVGVSAVDSGQKEPLAYMVAAALSPSGTQDMRDMANYPTNQQPGINNIAARQSGIAKQRAAHSQPQSDPAAVSGPLRRTTCDYKVCQQVLGGRQHSLERRGLPACRGNGQAQRARVWRGVGLPSADSRPRDAVRWRRPQPRHPRTHARRSNTTQRAQLGA